MNTKQKINVLATQEEPVEIIAASIVKVSDAFEKLNSGRLRQRVIVLLIKDMCKTISVYDIEKILDAVPRLKEIYLKKTTAK